MSAASNLADFESRLRTTAESVLHGVPSPLRDSILYSLLGPGKRVRPRLVIALCEALDVPEAVALRLATAIEMIHAYTLIHDDLPALDNDDFRRGRPTNHKVYGEATALLAGDSLALLAADVILRMTGVSAEGKISALATLVEAGGARGVIAGQAGESLLTEKPELDGLLEVFRLKTGALFRATLLMPLACDSRLSAEGKAELGLRLGTLGDALGSAFQIADDLEDDFITARINPAHVAHYLELPDAAALGASLLSSALESFTVHSVTETDRRIGAAVAPFVKEILIKIDPRLKENTRG